MTNFDYLQDEPKFNSFSSLAVTAEKVFGVDTGLCVISCRRAMEMAVKWMYSVDSALILPYQATLYSLMSTEEFRDLVGFDIWKRMELIRKTGNAAAHSSKKIRKEQAQLCLENLFILMDFIACCYADRYEVRNFDSSLPGHVCEISAQNRQEIQDYAEPSVAQSEAELNTLMVENRSLKSTMTARREEQAGSYVPRPLDLSEYETRKIYVDAMLQDAGWKEGSDWLNEVELPGMPNHSGTGFADYVLYDDAHRALAVIEAKKTCVDVSKGRQQAKLYADILERKYGRRPVIFLTNGFDTRIDDGRYPERKVASIYSKEDLEKLFNLQTMRESLNRISVNKDIAGRYYQEAAVKAVCDSFGQRNRRKALLVMATGSGKTRTVIALCDVLLQKGWVKNILFLADRNSLVTQAKRSFVNLLPDLSVTNLCEEKDNYSAHGVFSTYQTMMNCIDSVKTEDRKIFTCGHFDLVICDEAHRSIYNKYRDIFTYFDAPLVGLTATPKDEIDKNTYEIFELENGVPTYGYDLAQAVRDGYLVPYLSVETQLNFIENGIVYSELSEEEKEEYEKTFEQEDGEIPESISSTALNSWIFNEDTIRQVLHIVMTEGLKIQYGERIGKTIIFAKNHNHAEKILEVFGKEYPHLPGFAKVIDNHMTYAQSAIDEFSESDKLPQIAISVDMLDTGIDVPEVVNLVFFKKVMSKAKFWQMIGRGTRLCPGLIDGEDKEKFYIFDFCGNFEFFRENKGRVSAGTIALQGAVFHLKFEITYKLQSLEYQIDRLIAYRKALVAQMAEKVRELNRENFSVRQHLKYVDLYASEDNYNALTYEDTLVVREELAPLILPDKDHVSAVRFDALMYGIELAYLIGKKYSRARSDLLNRVSGIAGIANIPEIREQSDLIHKILHTDYLEAAGINEFELIREKLRDLMKYIPKKDYRYDTDFEDEILSVEWKEAELENDDLKNYKAKAEYYIRQHQDNEVIAKLKSNVPLSREDVEILEQILWSDLGTKQEYEKEYGEKPLGEFVREIVGLDMNAAKEAFSEYLNEAVLDERQIYFVNQIVEYIVQNGMMKDLSVLQEAPFTDCGNIIDLFGDEMQILMGIRGVIDQINANAAAA
ncbi:MAG: DEAD/DEAH box helicase family protein [Lachnospiraceae bacterium]|nr:DEAD/DEAH box helicase family protein [Lachnospiraceae bacterium]